MMEKYPESIDDLVDKILDRHEKKEDFVGRNIKKEEIPPFRYLTDEDEIKSVLMTDKPVSNVDRSVSSMRYTLPDEINMVDGVRCIAGLGNTEKIESVIQRYIKTRGFNKKQ